MMKRSLIGATFAVAFAGAVGVSAGTTANLKGSDTLFDLTNAVYAACTGPGGVSPGPLTGPYAGTGSGNGQNAMTGSGTTAGTQQVAPMSRFLNGGACTTGGTHAGAAAEGLVIALDGLSIVGSKTTFANAACNGADNLTCDKNLPDNTGAAWNPANPTNTIPTSAGTYTLTGWRDVLRVLLAGFSNTNTGTNAAAVLARDCKSPERVALASNYGFFFENHCTAPAGDLTGGVCTQIRHIFRRDDFSGTTDTVVALLNLPSVVPPETTVGGVVQHTGYNPFCNSVRPGFSLPAGNTCLVGADATWDPTQKNVGTGCTKENAVYRSTMQDNDPIRRTCVTQEDVCSHSGDLGLVLPMNDIPEPSPRSNTDRYNPTPCVRKLASATAPEVYDAITQARQICTRGLLCPNGDVCNNLGGCLVPTEATGNTQCLASKLTAPATPISGVAVPLAHPVSPGVAEGRAYNQHLYVQVGSAGAYQQNGFATPFPVTGAYYRIHTTHSLSAAVPNCRFADTTDQIGCLVEASPCSIGYAGLTAVVTNTGAGSIKINKQTPEILCIQGGTDPMGNPVDGFTYPFSRKLYLSSVIGFGNATGEELQLAGCETNLAQPSGTGAGLMTSGTTDVANFGFIHIAAGVNGGQPYCEDYNEAMLCPSGTFASNTNACAAAQGTLTFPSVNTVCGDGVKDPYEDCDCGLASVPATGAANIADCAGTVNGGTICTTTCRHVQ